MARHLMLGKDFKIVTSGRQNYQNRRMLIHADKCNIKGQAGFSYMGILMLMVIAGISMAATSLVWHTQQQRVKEQQLLFAGTAIRKAIASYYLSNPSGLREYPPSLEALLLDKRHPTIKRHLRRLYEDPMTKKQNWLLIMQNNRVIGVYSNSKIKPIKMTDFPAAYENFSNAKTYQDWKFVHISGIE